MPASTRRPRQPAGPPVADRQIARRIAAGAGLLGISASEYAAHLAAGEKWCSACKAWHARSRFGSDASRADGLTSCCLLSLRRPGRARDEGWLDVLIEMGGDLPAYKWTKRLGVPVWRIRRALERIAREGLARPRQWDSDPTDAA